MRGAEGDNLEAGTGAKVRECQILLIEAALRGNKNIQLCPLDC